MAIARPVARSHTLSVLSCEAETTHRPSSVTAHALTLSALTVQRDDLAARRQLPYLVSPHTAQRIRPPTRIYGGRPGSELLRKRAVVPAQRVDADRLRDVCTNRLVA